MDSQETFVTLGTQDTAQQRRTRASPQNWVNSGSRDGKQILFLIRRV